MILQQKIEEQLPEWRDRVKKLVTECGKVRIDEVTINQAFGGMRDIKSLVSDISYVDPREGIRLRGHTIPFLLEKLPKHDNAEIPYIGGLYYLLLVGEMPTKEEALHVENEWKRRQEVPGYVFDVIRTMPADTHPMTLFSQAVLALQRESIFAKEYSKGIKKADYWIPTLEDSLNLTAKVPTIAAFIYQWKYGKGELAKIDENLDWAGNFAKMMKKDSREYEDLSRLYFLIHSDHESGNVSAHATHLVGSALSDVYYATSAGLNGLAGPLHGLANQECLRWLLGVQEEFGHLPSHDELRQFTLNTLNSGQVIPGYGHAVLRKTDPRFIAQLEFGKKHFPEDELFQLAESVYMVVPGVLKEQGKVRDPWPNVDAISGTLQYHYDIREYDFYTVMFGVSRLLGVTANAVWARALNQPIERPKSVTTSLLEEFTLEGCE
jgi:citrate synthase